MIWYFQVTLIFFKLIRDYWPHQNAIDFGKETKIGYFMQDNGL